MTRLFSGAYTCILLMKNVLSVYYCGATGNFGLFTFFKLKNVTSRDDSTSFLLSTRILSSNANQSKLASTAGSAVIRHQ